MRRIVALMMVVVLLCATALPVRALPEFNDQNYLVDDYIQAVYDRYEADYNSGSFCSWEQYYQNDARFAYVMSDYAFENHTGLAKKYIDIAEALIDDTYLLDPDRTNVDVKVQYYEVALLSLIKTVEQNLLSYEVQSSADETMTTFDYLIEGAGAAAFLAGLPEGDAVVKGVQTLISSVSGSISILDECLNTLESDDDWAVLEKMWITYDNVERILAAIEDYPHAEGDETMGYLKQAARNLRTGMKYSLLANLNNFNEFLGKTTEEIGSFVFSDVLETVTEQEMKVVAPAMQATDWECLRLVSKAAKFMGNITGMINAGVFLGDCLVGASDVLLRYHEIRAMAAVRRAVLYQAQLLHLNINGVEDTALIQEFGEYLHDLLYITARGEYCVYSLQTEDANLLTLLVDGEEREWYGMAMTQLSQEYNNVSSLYPNIGFYLRDENSLSDVDSFTAVIENVQKNINYQDYSSHQKEYCRGEFFEIDGKKALVLLYYTSNNSVLTPGYYVGLWVENTDGAISCFKNTCFGEVSDSDGAYVFVTIREIHGKLYLNPYLRTTQNNTDISKNQYYCIDDTLELEYDLYSEVPFVSMGDGLIRHDESKAKYFLNQEKVSEQAFYGLQDELNHKNIVIDLCPFSSEGQDPQGKTFEYLLEQMANMEAHENSQGNVTEIYKWTLQQHPEAYSYQLPVNGEKKTFSTPTEYTLYDIDKNGVPELVVRERSTQYYIYTFDGVNAVQCGNFYWSYHECLRAFDGNGLIVHDGGTGSLHLEYVSRYELNGNDLQAAELLYDGESDSAEELNECLNRYAPITGFYPITDYSLLES